MPASNAIAARGLERSKGETDMTTRILSTVVALVLCLCAGTRGAGGAYQTARPEGYRPQFHWTSERNWLNDPNGLVYYKGVYHLFFQHNPRGNRWGNMTWGHAVSPDLVHWTQLEHALHPDDNGVCFSGSAVIDWNNTAGFKTGAEDVMVAIYTSQKGRVGSQSVAYSNDRGTSWTKCPGNPVLVDRDRDPKVMWHEPTKKWVMVLFGKGGITFYSSPDLKKWTHMSTLRGWFECPDLFELAVDGDPKRTKWVIHAAKSEYQIGTFDGTTFRPETGKLVFDYGKNFYAAQSYSDIPAEDGRRIQIGWMRNAKYPGMPFNQQMSFPCVLTLRTFPDGIRMCRLPVKEIENLHGKEHELTDLILEPGENPLAGVRGDLFDIRAEFIVGNATSLGFDVRGQKVEYSVGERKVSALGRSAPLEPVNGRIRLQILVDRTSIEVFGNDGRVSMTTAFLPKPEDMEFGVFAAGGKAKIVSLKVHELFSSWERWPQPGRPRKKKPAEAKEKKADAPPRPTVSPEERKAESLFRTGRQAERIRQRDAAVVLYEKILKDYPDTEAAGRARERLDSLSK